MVFHAMRGKSSPGLDLRVRQISPKHEREGLTQQVLSDRRKKDVELPSDSRLPGFHD